ncbi:MAG: prepilin-type N-terminal cleavage/methylation domain-containing protein [Coriobacteriales bacterium]|jgi:prepilin-type N-terminal cleavage/methylation domain-containing protein|nr:prepilin-type N-terminal cleavage/methylation domain-containing protein [Coriobacteriales bacterium]
MRATSKAGFTLVEVIVVLVILAILAAIAIPALTGYIKKAEDQQYSARAREISVAMRTVLIEGYADGEYASATASKYFKNGGVSGTTRWFSDTALSKTVYGSEYLQSIELRIRASKLLGEKYPNTKNWPLNPGYWQISFAAPSTSGADFSQADGFLLVLYPEGTGGPVSERTIVYVTYRLSSMDSANYWDYNSATTSGALAYDADAGYAVYRFAYPT